MRSIDTAALVLVCAAQPLIVGLISGASDALWVILGINVAILICGVAIVWFGKAFTDAADFWLNYSASHVAFFVFLCVDRWVRTQPDVVGAMFVFVCVWTIASERRAAKLMSPMHALQSEAFGLVTSSIVVSESFVATIGPAAATFLLIAFFACLLWYGALLYSVAALDRAFWAHIAFHVFWLAVFVFQQASQWYVDNAWYYVGFALVIAYYGFTFVLKAIQVASLGGGGGGASFDWSKGVYVAAFVGLLICYAIGLARTGDSILNGAFAIGFAIVFAAVAFREDEAGLLNLSGQVVSFGITTLVPPPNGWAALGVLPILVAIGSAMLSWFAPMGGFSYAHVFAISFSALNAAAIATSFAAPPVLNGASIVLIVCFLLLFLWSAAKFRGAAYTVISVLVYAVVVSFQTIYFSVTTTTQYATLFIVLGVYAVFFAAVICWSSRVVKRLNA